MDTRLLEYFAAVADELSVTRAADRLYAAQSTVSAGLRSLERELGVKLLARTTRSVELTPEGEHLLPAARAVLDEVDALRSLAAESSGGLRGRVRLGTFSGMQPMDLPRVLGKFHRAYPLVDVQVTASPSGSSGLLEDIRQGRLDLAFTSIPAPDLETWELGSVPFVALVPEGHPLAEHNTVTLAQLAEYPWVDLLAGYGNRIQIDQLLTERGLSRRVAVEVNTLPSIPEFVANGLGVALFPAEAEAPGCHRLELADVSDRFSLRLVARSGAARRSQVAALVGAITSAPTQLV